MRAHWAIPILASILILGVIVLSDDAFAKKTPEPIEVGDEITLKGKGGGTCSDGDTSGTAKANTRFLLKVREVDGDNFSGVAKAIMKLNATCEGAPRELVTDGSLAFTLDKDNGILTMSGNLKARDGTIYSLDVIGQVNEGKKTTIDMNLELVGDNGITFEIPILGGVVFMPISS